MTTTTEPRATTALRAAFQQYWLMQISPLVGWDGTGEAPTMSMAMLHVRLWKLWLVATTQEGVVG